MNTFITLQNIIFLKDIFYPDPVSPCSQIRICFCINIFNSLTELKLTVKLSFRETKISRGIHLHIFMSNCTINCTFIPRLLGTFRTSRGFRPYHRNLNVEMVKILYDFDRDPNCLCSYRHPGQ